MKLFFQVSIFLFISLQVVAQTQSQLKLTSSIYIDGLSKPWDLAFSTNGYAFFTEKCEGLSVRYSDGKIKKLFGRSSDYLEKAADLFCEGQSGMLGVAVDPEFTKNNYLYVYMLSNLNKDPRTNRVVRLKLNSDSTKVLERKDIVTDIAYKNSFNSWGRAGAHSGGRIRFGPDDYLYITTGDNHNGQLPQDLKSLGGKILRVDRDGKAAPNNNNLKNADPRILTYGHRNVQGVAFRIQSNQVFASEHGPGHTDEVNIIQSGKNYGWDPKPEASVSCFSDYCGYTSNKIDKSLTPMTDLKKFPDAISPIWNNEGNSQGTGSLAFIEGTQWKNVSGSLLVGVMARQRLVVLKLDENGKVLTVQDADLPAERYRSLVQGFDGFLYIVTDGGAIWKASLK
jgi:glucose/arabinose dehydrogenase